MSKFNIKDITVNGVIRHFVLADLLFFAGWGLIGPIFALFVSQKIPGANLVIVGTAVAIYWVVKSVLQVPVAIFLDKNKGEKDDFYTLLIGLSLAGFTALGFLFINNITGLYIMICFQGLAFGLYTPSWSAIFTRHLDKENCSLDWSVDSAAIGIGSGIAAFIGGNVAAIWGFNAVFFATSILSFASVFILFSLPKLILPKPVSKDCPVVDPVVSVHHDPLNLGK